MLQTLHSKIKKWFKLRTWRWPLNKQGKALKINRFISRNSGIRLLKLLYHTQTNQSLMMNFLCRLCLKSLNDRTGWLIFIFVLRDIAEVNCFLNNALHIHQGLYPIVSILLVLKSKILAFLFIRHEQNIVWILDLKPS